MNGRLHDNFVRCVRAGRRCGGNAETDSRADGPGTMETTYFGTATAWGTGDGPGPWIEADFEGGVFSGYNAKTKRRLSDH